MIWLSALFYLVFAFCLITTVVADYTKTFLHRGPVLFGISVIAFAAFIATL